MNAYEDVNRYVIMGFGNGLLPSFCAAAGCPIGTVPLGYADFNGRAFGMHIIASPGCESTIFEIMSAWESTFPEARKAPRLLISYNPAEQ